MLAKILWIDGSLLGAGGVAIAVVPIAQSFGISVEQTQAALLAVCTIAYILLRREVDRFIAAMALVRELDTRQLRLAQAVGLTWDHEAQNYVAMKAVGELLPAQRERR
jgi:hypothetical protein